MIKKSKLQIARAPKVLIGIPQNFACELSFVCQWNCSMLLLLSKKEVVKLQSRLCDFVLNFQVSRRACYSFWGRPNLVIYRWNFANPCKNFGARAKKHLLAASHRHLVGTDFLRRCLGMSPKFATAQLPTVPQPCFQRWRLKSTGQVSPV